MYDIVVVAVLVTCTLQTTLAGMDVQCPPWFISYNSNSRCSFPQCICSDHLPYMIKCIQREHASYLRLGHCAFYNTDSNDTIVAPCPYVFPGHLFEEHFLQLPEKRNSLNSFICTRLNREVGNSMCGRCANGTGPSVNSVGIQCVECRAINILYYLLLQYLPATITFLVVLLFRINVTSAPMAYYVLFCNGVAVFFRTSSGFYTTFAFSETPYKYSLRAFLTLNSVWSFDLLYFVSPALCLSPHIEEINIPYLDTLATLYPFLLLLLAYVVIEFHSCDFRPVVTLCKPLHRILVRFRRSWNPNASLVQAFATVFYISYSKLLFMVYIPFARSDFMNEKGHVLTDFEVTYIDPTVPFGHRKHIYIMIFSICILFFIVMPPILILMFYPTRVFGKLQGHLSPRMNLSLFIFVNTFQGCYKDGTNGTRDYRTFSGGYLALCVLLLVIQSSTSSLIEVNDREPMLSRQIPIFMLIALLVANAVLRPYKSEVANHSVVTLLALMIVCYTLLNVFDSATTHTIIIVFIALLSLPHCVFYGYVVYRLGKLLKQANVIAAIGMTRGPLLNHT